MHKHQRHCNSRHHPQTLFCAALVLLCGSGLLGCRTISELLSSPAPSSWHKFEAPFPQTIRALHTAVWTGTHMIIWGGLGNSSRHFPPVLARGYAFEPNEEKWAPLASRNEPLPRFGHTAIWTGKEMLVWGGKGAGQKVFGSGARYHPTTQQWKNIANKLAPSQRFNHTAVWTGKEMIIWGGQSNAGLLSTGAAYNPATDKWRKLPAGPVNSDFEARKAHAAHWCPQQKAMVIWGGMNRSGHSNTGWLYKTVTGLDLGRGYCFDGDRCTPVFVKTSNFFDGAKKQGRGVFFV